MNYSKESRPENGSGYLVLKSGTSEPVQWEIDSRSDGALDGGRVRGNANHLAQAAEDGCAILRLTMAVTMAIAVESHDDTEASFRPLLVQQEWSVFEAQGIVGSASDPDSDQFSIQFLNREGESLLVTIPKVIMRDYLPLLQHALPSDPPGSVTTSYIRIPSDWKTALARASSHVCLVCSDDPPLGFSPQDARRLAEQLIEGAKKIEARPKTTH